jgi:hypothetical protein
VDQIFTGKDRKDPEHQDMAHLSKVDHMELAQLETMLVDKLLISVDQKDKGIQGPQVT